MEVTTLNTFLVYFLISSTTTLCMANDNSMDEMVNYMESLSGNKKRNLFQQVAFEATSSVFSEAVLANIQAMRYVMTSSNSAMDIPSLDPWTAPDVEFAVYSKEFNINGTIEDITVYNLSTYKILQWETQILSGTFGIGFDEITLEADFNVDANTSNIIWISIKDHISATIYGFNLTDGVFQFQLENGKLSLKNLSFNIDYERIQVNFTNLDYDTIVGRLIQESIDYFVEDALREQKDEMAVMLANNMADGVNNIFKKLTLQQMFNYVKTQVAESNKTPEDTDNTLKPETSTETDMNTSEPEIANETATNMTEPETTSDVSENTTEPDTSTER